ncbi:MAG: NAD-dependent epimerase/dehydratase family protein, partial [Flavobacteriaceae bacterium]|nr:NAD-dependent epimerase/dehydratase family protein [Flavobacteriaceae bacterium]
MKLKENILILGASGFIGNVLYKELLPYYKVFGTYCEQQGLYEDNQVFHRFKMEKDDILPILKEVQPTIIISALRGDFKEQFHLHKTIAKYIKECHHCRLLFCSSASVFDAATHLPAYEKDRPMAQSEYGKFKYSVEKLLREHIPTQHVILRLPTVLGINAPAVVQLRQAMKHQAAFESYPNKIITVTTA